MVLAGTASGKNVPFSKKNLPFSKSACSWSIVSSPNSGMPDNTLRGTAVVSANDVWAVGDATSNPPEPGQPLIEHWDGAAWTIVASPPLSDVAGLDGVAANSSNDVWTVGEVADQTLTEHWNGKNWQVVPSPSKTVNGQPTSNVLTGVVALAPNDVWAVGYAATITVAETLILHWNGGTWNIVPSPSPGEGNGYFYDQLLGVTAVRSIRSSTTPTLAPDDVWAAGQGTTDGESHNLIEHWSGDAWNVVASPHFPNTNDDFMQSVSAITANDIWAVGAFSIPNAEGSPLQTATLHWDGTSWSIVPSPSPSSNFDVLNGVAGTTSNDVWAVGSFDDDSGLLNPLVEHWGGAGWSVFPSPAGEGELLAVATVSSTDAWSVGEQAGETLIEHFTCQ